MFFMTFRRLLDAPRVVVALGGNALQREDDVFSLDAMKEALFVVCDVFRDRALTIVHGNGPQVTSIMERGMTFSAAIEETQDITFQLALEAMMELGLSTENVVMQNTRVIVDPHSSAFRNPSKPVGLWMPNDSELVANGHDFIERNGEFRRVVASPDPLELVDAAEINGWLDERKIVFAGGGGGIPVDSRVRVLNVDAVIDKDMVAELLRQKVQAGLLIILTAVPGYIKNFGTDRAELIRRMKCHEALSLRELPEMAGSMGPKLTAAGMAASRGATAIVTDFDGLRRLSDGDDSQSTIVTPL